MSVEFIIGVIIAIAFGIIFYITEYLSEKNCIICEEGKPRERYLSFIAGISVAYFFLVLLPTITVDIHEIWIEVFPFLAIMIGFVLFHVSEKMILHRVEYKTRAKIDELRSIEYRLELEENNIRDFINAEIIKEDWEHLDNIRRLAQMATEKHHNEIELRHQESELRDQLAEHMCKDLDMIHSITNFFYHLLIGLLLATLLVLDIFAGILFFLFAFFKTEVLNVTNRHIEIEGLNFHMGLGDSTLKKLILPASVLLGIVGGVLFEIFYPLPPIIIQILLAFVSGIILYITVRELIPIERKGKPKYFLVGIVIFSGILFITYYIQLIL